MKEDILEQLVEDYLCVKGYFTTSNVKFRPDRSSEGYDARQDSVHSDIDVLGYHPLRQGPTKVVAVSCKSLQEGFDPKWELAAMRENRTVGGRDAWRRYRELWNPKWAKAFRTTVHARTGADQFTYVTAVTHLIGAREPWERCQEFERNLGCSIRVLTLQEMIGEVLGGLHGTTVANSQLGRTIQLFRAAGIPLESTAALQDESRFTL